MEYVKIHRHIKLLTIEARRNYLMSEPNYHTINFFSEYLLAIEMKKQTNKQTKQNKKHTHKINE